MGVIDSTKAWARRIKRDAVTLWFAKSHPRTPLLAKALGVFVVAYALSPIDLIPDFIPVLGYLDDVVLLPILIWLTVRMLPPDVVIECRQQAERWMAEAGSKPRSRGGAIAIVLIWVLVAGAAAYWLSPFLARYFSG
jgi:uncharacterized membrane protein YkvA (DUF1232 family)